MKVVVLNIRNASVHIQELPPSAQGSYEKTKEYIHDRYHDGVDWMAMKKGDVYVEQGINVHHINRSEVPLTEEAQG